MTRIKPRTLALAFVSLAFATGQAQVEAKTTLRWKLKAGDVLYYQTNQSTTSKIKIQGGKEVTQTLSLVIDMTWTIKSVEADGSAAIAQSIDRIRTSAASPFEKFQYDSGVVEDAKGPAGPLFAMLVGVEFAGKLGPRGTLTDLKLPEKLLKTLREGNGPEVAYGQFSEPGLKNMLAQLVFPLPEEGVDAGAKWERKLAIPAGPDGQTREIVQEFAYRGAADPAAGQGKLEAIDLVTRYEPAKLGPDVQITIMKQEAKGRYLWDNEGGRIESSRVTEVVDVAGKVDGREISQANETTTVLTRSAAKPK